MERETRVVSVEVAHRTGIRGSSLSVSHNPLSVLNRSGGGRSTTEFEVQVGQQGQRHKPGGSEGIPDSVPPAMCPSSDKSDVPSFLLHAGM